MGAGEEQREEGEGGGKEGWERSIGLVRLHIFFMAEQQMVS